VLLQEHGCSDEMGQWRIGYALECISREPRFNSGAGPPPAPTARSPLILLEGNCLCFQVGPGLVSRV
jgi:hypothetical protein